MNNKADLWVALQAKDSISTVMGLARNRRSCISVAVEKLLIFEHSNEFRVYARREGFKQAC